MTMPYYAMVTSNPYIGCTRYTGMYYAVYDKRLLVRHVSFEATIERFDRRGSFRPEGTVIAPPPVEHAWQAV